MPLSIMCSFVSANHFTVAVLAKEVALTAAGAFFLFDVLRKRRIGINISIILLPLLSYFSWQLYIRAHTGIFSFNVSEV